MQNRTKTESAARGNILPQGGVNPPPCGIWAESRSAPAPANAFSAVYPHQGALAGKNNVDAPYQERKRIRLHVRERGG